MKRATTITALALALALAGDLQEQSITEDGLAGYISIVEIVGPDILF